MAGSAWGSPIGFGDAAYYRGQSLLVADGRGYINPFASAVGLRLQSASHPPLFTTLLAAARLVGITSVDASRVLCCVVGALAIVVMGLLGRELAGARAGLLAAGITAAYPVWWVTDGLLLSEVLYIPLITGLLLLAYRLWRAPTLAHALALGVIGGLAGLTRSEGLLVLALVTVPLVLVLPQPMPTRRRALLASAVLAAAAIVVTPWVAYNLARFREPVLMSTNEGVLIQDSNCPRTYSGAFIGWFLDDCWPANRVNFHGDESQNDRMHRELGLRYARDHATRVPAVVAARLGRVAGVYRPIRSLENDAFGRWGHAEDWLMLVAFYVAVVGAVVGGVVLRRRRITLVPFMGTFVAIAITVAASYGLVRLRVPADVALIAMAAVGLDAALARVGRERGSASMT